MLYSSISQKKGSDKVRVGIIIENNNSEILLVKDDIDRINKQIYNIPFVDVKDFKETEIIDAFSCKYGFKIDKVDRYINESRFLDENCDEKLQINMSCKSNEPFVKNSIWSTVEDVLGKTEVPNATKQCIEVYNYNSNLR